MGNKNGIEELSLHIEKNCCFCGEEVTGVVNIKIEKFLDRPVLMLSFKGMEKTKWSKSNNDSDSDGLNGTETTYKGDCPIFTISKELYSWEDGLKPGNYSIPFAYILPSEVPGSFDYDNRDSIKAKISYKFQAILLNNSNQEILKGKIKLFLKHPREFCSYNISLNRTIHLRSWCCLNKGHCKFRLSYPQDTYSPSQVVSFNLEVDNSESLLSIRKLNCVIYQDLKLKDNSSEVWTKTKIVINQRVHVKINPGERLEAAEAVQFHLNLPLKMRTLEHMYSTDRKLIKCIYFYRIWVNFGGIVNYGKVLIFMRRISIVPNSPISLSAPSMPDD